MKLIHILFAFVGAVLFCSWHDMKQSPINKAKWVIGTWENKTEKGSIFETWAIVSNVEFAGKSYVLKNNDTAIIEHIRLIEKQDKLFYIPTVNDENNNLPVSFSLQKISDTQIVFENPDHDFPQIISYRRITQDSLVAEISGTKNGQVLKQSYPMKRIKTIN